MAYIPKAHEIDLVIFHASCADGFTSAWAAWKLLGDRAEYVSAKYGDKPPDVNGRKVAIVDFSYKRDELIAMAERASSLIVLDHHKSAKKDLDGFKNAIFDLDKSGATLTWEFFHPNEPVPLFVKYIQDRDLWQWKLPMSQEFSAALQIRKMDFETWDKVNEWMKDPVEKCKFLEQGTAVISYRGRLTKSHAKHSRIITFYGVKMWCVNASNIISETGEALRTKEAPDGSVPGVSLMWFYDFDSNVYRCSMRSRDDRADVSEIAQDLGGGGHRNAAGFEWKEDIRKLMGNEPTSIHQPWWKFWTENP